MQKVIPPQISYSVSDSITWEIFIESNNRELDFSNTPSIITLNENIISGILVPLGTKEILTLEPFLGFQTSSTAFFKCFVRDLDYQLKNNRHVLRMLSHVTNHGFEMSIVTGDFLVVKTPNKIDSENWIYLYKFN